MAKKKSAREREVHLLVGTRKGGFLFRSDQRRRRRQIAGPFFAGWEVNHLIRDQRSHKLYAAIGNDYNPGVYASGAIVMAVFVAAPPRHEKIGTVRLARRRELAGPWPHGRGSVLRACEVFALVDFRLREEGKPAEPIGEVAAETWQAFVVGADQRLFGDAPRPALFVE